MSTTISDQLLVGYAVKVVADSNQPFEDHLRCLEMQDTANAIAKCDRKYKGEQCQREDGHPGSCAALIIF